MKPLRVRGRVLQTPVIRLADESGRKVTIVGALHMAEAGYYASIEALLGSLEASGATICFEMIEEATEEELAAATSAERDAVRLLRAGGAPYRRLGEYCNWTFQKTALSYKDSWLHGDITELDLVRMLGPEWAAERDAGVSDLETQLGDDFGIALGALAGLLFRGLARMPTLTGKLMRRDLAEDAVILDRRNEHALSQLPEGNAVLLWGAEHVDGLIAGLKASGFAVKAATSWMPAATLPGVITCIRDLAGVLRRFLRRDEQ